MSCCWATDASVTENERVCGSSISQIAARWGGQSVTACTRLEIWGDSGQGPGIDEGQCSSCMRALGAGTRCHWHAMVAVGSCLILTHLAQSHQY